MSTSSVAGTVQTPDFILDVEKWTIRRYAEVAGDVKNSGGYGIISYAWGKWHDKSQYVLGGTLDNVNPNGYPTFDIGVSQEDSVTGPERYIASKVPTQLGTTEQYLSNPRKIPKETPLSWIFPRVCPIDSQSNVTDHKVDIFTIDQVKKVLRQMGTRYVWWDWVCIPQGWDYDWRPFVQTSTNPPETKRGVSKGPEFQSHAELKPIADASMNKMRFFYPASTVGCLWWHETSWASAGLVPGSMEQIVNLFSKVTSSNQFTLDLLTALLDNLDALSKSESSLQSLWSFQEAVLFSSTARPEQKVAPKGLPSPSVILDKNAAPYNFASKGDHTGLYFQSGQLNLQDIVTIVSVLFGLITGCLFRLDPTPALGLSQLQKWCLSPANETAARALLARLLRTGFVGLRFNNPLLLLEARFSRETRPDQPAIDVAVNTIMGAVSVDLTKEQEAAEQKLTLVPNASGAIKATIKYDIMRRGYLSKLFATYQWRMLLFARGTTAAGNIWETLISTTRSRVAALDPYTGADDVLSRTYGPDAGSPNNDTVSSLPKLVVEANPDVPVQLRCQMTGNYDIYNYAEAVLSKDISNKTAKTTFDGWATAVFYDYVVTPDIPAVAPATAPTLLPGTVRPVLVPFAQRVASLGPDVVLFPVQKSVPQPRVASADKTSAGPNWLRCFIMVRDDAAQPTMLRFRGVGDFFKLQDGKVTPKNIEFSIA